MGEAWILNSDNSEQAFFSHVKKLRKEHKYLLYAAPRIGEDRSLSANALSHMWYGYADKMLGFEINSTRRYCKLHFGVPILRAEDAEFIRAYDTFVKPHSYEAKLKFMDFFPVTSRMTRLQMSRYMECVQRYHATEHSLVLESKGEFNKFQRDARGQNAA